MIPVSTDYRQQLIAGNRNWVIKIPVFLSGNTGSTPDFTLTNEHIWDNGIVLDEAISSDNSFDIGAAIVGSLKVVIDNITGNFSQYDFYGAKLTLWLGVEGDEDDGEQRYYRMGFFVVDTPSYNGSLITLNCLDNMTWFDTDFDTSWVNWTSSSTTTGSVVSTICSHVGVALATSQFPWYDISLKGLKPEQKLTCREVLQYIAQICCCYCKIDTAGELVLNWYDKNAIINIGDYDGGTFNTTTTPYSDGDAVDGRLFDPWETGDEFNGGMFDDLLDRAFISENFEIEVSTDDIQVTGCRVRNNSSKEKAYDVLWVDSTFEQQGHERYVLVVENNPFVMLDSTPLASGEDDRAKASSVANRVGNKLARLPIRGFSSTSLADFSYETGDMATVIDFRGNRYYTWITHFTFTTNNSERFNCGAQSVKQRSEQRFSTLAETTEKARVALTAYDTAVKELNTLGQNAIGYSEYFYPATGSNRVMYRYNLGTVDVTDPANPKFPNATVVFKISGDGVFIAQKALGGIDPDGTCHFTNGYDANSGTAILNLVYVRGLNADWIKAGSIDASVITVNNLNASNITSGNIAADRMKSNVISAVNLSSSTIDTNRLSVSGIVGGINSGTTTIDGGKITAHTITSNEISVDNLAAISANMGTLTSGSINGGTITGYSKFSMTAKTSSKRDSTLNWGDTWDDSLTVAIDNNDKAGIGVCDKDHKYTRAVYMHYDDIEFYDDNPNPKYAYWTGSKGDSDKRLKKNVRKLTSDMLQTFYGELEPIVFNYKKQVGIDGTFFGVFAQDMEKALKAIGVEDSTIVYDSKGGYKKLLYADTIGFQIGGIKDLYEIVNKQQTEIELLKQELAELKARVK